MADSVQKEALEAALEAVPQFARPDAALEQYRTPAAIAADLLWEAHQEDAIAGRVVADLGCGTGMFTLGAHLLGARRVTGVDVDLDALGVAHDVLGTAGAAPASAGADDDDVPGAAPVGFVHSDVADWRPGRRYDTIVMNPPFGAQARGADRPFYAAAARAQDAGGTCWFLAQPRTERFLAQQAQALGASLERVKRWSYPIEARFAFHEHAVKRFDVAGYRMAW